MIEKQSCDSCRYGFQFDLEGNSAQSAVICRRYPPAVLEHNYDNDGGLYYGCWPTVYLDNWCGEYQPVVRG